MGRDFQLWSEFNPKLYRLKAVLTDKAVRAETSGVFGMREFRADGRHFTINGQPVFLRGTVEELRLPEKRLPRHDGRPMGKNLFGGAGLRIEPHAFSHLVSAGSGV